MNRTTSTLIAVIILLFFAHCNTPRERVIECEWKYVEGFNIGDLLSFKNNYFKIDKENNIYKENIIVAKLVSIKHNEIVIESLSKEKGFYEYFSKIK